MSEFPDLVLPVQGGEQTDLCQDGVASSGNNIPLFPSLNPLTPRPIRFVPKKGQISRIFIDAV